MKYKWKKFTTGAELMEMVILIMYMYQNLIAGKNVYKEKM